MKTKIVYKVCEPLYVNRKAGWSWVMFGASGVGLKYTVGKITRPKVRGSKIFVCSSLREAEDFASGLNHVIFRCEARGYQRGGYRTYTDEARNPKFCADFWANSSAPRGAIPTEAGLCDSVKVLSVVSRKVDH